MECRTVETESLQVGCKCPWVSIAEPSRYHQGTVGKVWPQVLYEGMTELTTVGMFGKYHQKIRTGRCSSLIICLE